MALQYFTKYTSTSLISSPICKFNVQCMQISLSSQHKRTLYGVECWSRVLEWIIGMEWSKILEWKPSAQTKPGHILENNKSINFHSAGVGVSSYRIEWAVCFTYPVMFYYAWEQNFLLQNLTPLHSNTPLQRSAPLHRIHNATYE